MTIPQSVRDRVAQAAGYRCSYCQTPARYIFAPMEVDHIWPVALGGQSDESNLCYACPYCNGYKGMQVDAVDPLTNEKIPLFNPRTKKWSEHFKWGEDATQVIGVTPCGRSTVIALQINNDVAIQFRRIIVKAGWNPLEIE